MSHNYTIQYNDFAQELKIPYADGEYRYDSRGHRWGEYVENNIELNHFHIQESKINLNKKFTVLFTDEKMDDQIHFCACLKGAIQGQFCDGRITKSLTESQHHYVYAPAAEYELSFQEISYVHLAIDRNYYIKLLGDSEAWLAEMRTRLQRQEEMYPGGVTLTNQMKAILMNIMNTPLTGNLRELLLEAKILELVALQLGQYSNDGFHVADKVFKKERDVFHEIHEYLGRTFNEEHSLQSLSREFGINEFKLKQGFRQTFGTSVFSFIFDTKMDHARQLIVDQGMLVHEVSRQVGYKNPNHFSTAFKKKFGFTPNELKN